MNPEKELTTLMEWLDSYYEPAQLKYWEFEHHGTQKGQYEWVKKQQNTSHFDLRWKEELTISQSKAVLNSSEFNTLIKNQNLVQMENGLSLNQ